MKFFSGKKESPDPYFIFAIYLISLLIFKQLVSLMIYLWFLGTEAWKWITRKRRGTTCIRILRTSYGENAIPGCLCRTSNLELPFNFIRNYSTMSKFLYWCPFCTSSFLSTSKFRLTTICFFFYFAYTKVSYILWHQASNHSLWACFKVSTSTFFRTILQWNAYK